jgi:hypothetical protein
MLFAPAQSCSVSACLRQDHLGSPLSEPAGFPFARPTSPMPTKSPIARWGLIQVNVSAEFVCQPVWRPTRLVGPRKMRNLRLTTLAMVPLVAPVTAFATTWYVLNYRTGQCENSEAIVRRSGIAAFASPGALEAALKATNLFKATHIYRDDSGQVTGVAVINSGDIAMAYFPDLKHCQKAANEQ